MIAILAVGQTFVIITGGIDLSVGAVVGFATVIVAMLINAGVPIWLAILITLLVGVAIGMFHGFGIVKMGLPPFIITLATLTSLRGIGLLMTNGNSISINNDAFTGVLAQLLHRHPQSVLDGDPGRHPGLHLPASQPLGPLSVLGRLQRRGLAPVRRQRPAHHLHGLHAVRPVRGLRRRAAGRRASASATRPRPRAGSCRRSPRR